MDGGRTAVWTFNSVFGDNFQQIFKFTRVPIIVWEKVVKHFYVNIFGNFSEKCLENLYEFKSFRGSPELFLDTPLIQLLDHEMFV